MRSISLALAFTLLALAILACSQSTPSAPATPPPMSAVAAQPTSQLIAPSATSSLEPHVLDTPESAPASLDTPEAAPASLDPRALDTAAMEECSLLADSDFSALLGQTPADKVPEAEINRTACYYNFSGGQTVYVTIITNQPGKEVYDGRMQYLDSATDAEALTLGEVATVQERDGQVSIQAVVNGWYLALDGRGFERQAFVALARLFEERLIPNSQQAAEPTATPSDPISTAPDLGQCQNTYYPIVQGASWQYQLSGVSSGTFTRTVTAVRADGFDDQDVFSAGTTRKGSWACENGNLISLTPSSGATVASADVQAEFTIESNSGISFPADPQPGEEWAQNIVYLGQQSSGGVTIESRNVLATSCKAGNVETVKVPAGEFSALRVNCSTQIDIYISGNLVFSFTSSDSAWHAPGVGMVKSVGTTSMGNTEIVLLSYTLP